MALFGETSLWKGGPLVGPGAAPLQAKSQGSQGAPRTAPCRRPHQNQNQNQVAMLTEAAWPGVLDRLCSAIEQATVFDFASRENIDVVRPSAQRHSPLRSPRRAHYEGTALSLTKGLVSLTLPTSLDLSHIKLCSETRGKRSDDRIGIFFN